MTILFQRGYYQTWRQVAQRWWNSTCWNFTQWSHVYSQTVWARSNSANRIWCLSYGYVVIPRFHSGSHPLHFIVHLLEAIQTCLLFCFSTSTEIPLLLNLINFSRFMKGWIWSWIILWFTRLKELGLGWNQMKWNESDNIH